MASSLLSGRNIFATPLPPTDTLFPFHTTQHMLEPSPLILVAVTAVVTIFYTNRRRTWLHRLRGCRLPPGPRGWPIVGSLFDVPSGERPWTVYREWAQKYGDIIYFRVLGTPMIMISSADIILELTEKRSSIYSDKPVMIIDQLTGWDFNFATMPYNNKWRNVRKMFHQHFNQTVTPNYRDKQTREIHAFLRRCVEQPVGRPLDPRCIHLTLATIILDIVYGVHIESLEDEYLKLAVETFGAFSDSRAAPFLYWVEYMPFLRHVPAWVPGASAVKFGARWYPRIQEMINKPFDTIKQQLHEPQTANPSMASKLIMRVAREQDLVRKAEQEQNARYAAAIAYAAGADTTYSQIQTFFCCMAKHPELQKRAREELDRVVGPDRLPTYDDYNALPYIQAIFMECARWLPILPLTSPRLSRADDYFEGYFIPQGTVIIANLWQILRDPQDYPDPERFHPDRFLKNGTLNPDVRDPTTLAFGFGRRQVSYSLILQCPIHILCASNCPGRHLAKDNAFLTIASALHVFDILPAWDETGKELDITVQMTTGLISYPDKLNYTLRPRSEAAEKLVRSTA